MNPYISTFGIMFDTFDDQPFPTLDDVGYSWADAPTWRADVGDLARWFVVAVNPHRLAYFDDDSQAMDETNIDAVLASFVEYDAPDDADAYDPTEDSDDAAAEGRRPIYAYGRVYLVHPDDAEAIALAEGFRNALADYPLLDESSYSEREYDAWCEYVDNGLRYDTLRDLRDTLDDESVDAIDDAWDDIAPEAAQHLHYYNGWDGSHSPDFSECVLQVLADSLVTLARN